MKRLKKLRKELIGENINAKHGKRKKRLKKVEYVLVFAGSKKGKDDSAEQEKDDSYLYLDNLAKERITQLWTKAGGSIGGNNIDPTDPIRSNPM